MSTPKNKPDQENETQKESKEHPITGKENASIENPQKEHAYGDDFEPGPDENVNPESVTFEQDIESERQNDPERNPQKRKPLGEDENEIAEQERRRSGNEVDRNDDGLK